MNTRTLKPVPEYRTDAVRKLRKIADELEQRGDIHTISLVAIPDDENAVTYSVGRDAHRPLVIMGAHEMAKITVFTTME